MTRKIISVLLMLSLAVCLFAGCSTAGQIAGNVAEAAKAEFEKQIQSVLDEYHVEIVEVKTAAGRLNDSSDFQFFCAVLLKADSQSTPQACADALDKVFEKAGMQVQIEARVSSPYLVHKDVTFQHSNFSDSTYYTIYAYQSKIDLNLSNALKPN